MSAGVSRPGAETAGAAANEPEGSASPMDEVLALATLLEPEAFDPDVPAAPEWRERAKDTALGYAAKAITSGYRRVVVDDTTVERVAIALCDFDGYLWPEEGEVEAAAQAGLSFTIANTGYYLDRAQAAVRAVLGEDQP